MNGWAVVIYRRDGSHFFASPNDGFATPVWFTHAQALEHARACRLHKMDAVVVNVEYRDPIITKTPRGRAVVPAPAGDTP